MSLRRGLTSWVLRAGSLSVAYRWNMGVRDCFTTFQIVRGSRVAVACGPVVVEW